MIYGPKSPEHAPKMNPYSLNTDSADSLIPFIPLSPYLLILLSLYPLTPFSPIPLFPYPIFLQHFYVFQQYVIFKHDAFTSLYALSTDSAYPLIRFYPLIPLSPYPLIPLSSYPSTPLPP